MCENQNREITKKLLLATYDSCMKIFNEDERDNLEIKQQVCVEVNNKNQNKELQVLLIVTDAESEQLEPFETEITKVM